MNRIQNIVSACTTVREFVDVLLIFGKQQILKLYRQMLAINCSSGKHVKNVLNEN